MISKLIKSNNARHLINYLLKEVPHNKKYADKRNYLVGSQLIDPVKNNIYDPTYTSFQFAEVRSRARNTHKKTQAYHLIFSFSEDDFPTPHEKDPKKQKQILTQQASQAGKLIKGYLKEHFPDDAQYLYAIQRDGKGHKLHAHVAINSVVFGGKTLNTREYTTVIDTKRNVYDRNLHKRVAKAFKGINSTSDQYMLDHFKEVTGRDFVPVVPNKENLVAPEVSQIKTRGAYSWREDLKDQIYDAFSHSESLDEFKEACALNGITVTERHQKVTDGHGNIAKRRAFTYTFTSQEKTKTGKAKVYKRRDYYLYNARQRGLGLSFTPQALEREFEKQHDNERQRIQEYQQQKEAQLTNLINNVGRDAKTSNGQNPGLNSSLGQGIYATNQGSNGANYQESKHDNLQSKYNDLQSESNYAQSREDYSESEPNFDWNGLALGRNASRGSDNDTTRDQSRKKSISEPNKKHDAVILQTLINQRIINAWYKNASYLEEVNKSAELDEKEREKEAEKSRQQSETKTPDTYTNDTQKQRDNNSLSDDLGPDY